MADLKETSIYVLAIVCIIAIVIVVAVLGNSNGFSYSGSNTGAAIGVLNTQSTDAPATPSTFFVSKQATEPCAYSYLRDDSKCK